jgi:DNA-binding PadR family transcriptional regulator
MYQTQPKLRFAILELLSVKPLSGYELKKRFGGSIVFFWRAGHSQIYPELKKMEAESLVVANRVPHPWRPTKKVYAITQTGREELIRWLREKAEIQGVKDEMMLKCFAFHLIPADEAVRHIEHHRTLHEQRLQRYREIERDLVRKRGDPRESSDAILFWHHLTLQHATAFERMYIEWCEFALSEEAAFRARTAGSGLRVEANAVGANAATASGGSPA